MFPSYGYLGSIVIYTPIPEEQRVEAMERKAKEKAEKKVRRQEYQCIRL